MHAHRHITILNTIIVTAFLVLAAGPLFSRMEIVTVDGARLLAAPSAGGAMLRELKRGDVVEVLSELGMQETIDGKRGNWLSVTHHGTNGWLFSVFVEHGGGLFSIGDDGTVVWIELKSASRGTLPRFNIVNRRRHVMLDVSFDLLPDEDYGFDMAVSEGLAYVAIDCGTDVVGKVVIYSIKDRCLVHSAAYTRHRLKWVGRKISFEKVTYLGDGCLLWEEEIFDNGVVIKGKKKGKGGYHGSGKKDPKCN